MGKKSRTGCFSFCRHGKSRRDPAPPLCSSGLTVGDPGSAGAPSSSAGPTEMGRGEEDAPSSKETPVSIAPEQPDAHQAQRFPDPGPQTHGMSCDGSRDAQNGGVQFSISAQSQSNVVSNVMNNCNVNSVNIHTTFGTNADPNSSAKGVSLEEIRNKIKSMLKTKYECIFEGIPKRGNPSSLVSIYTELYMTKGESEQVNAEHEVWYVEAAAKRTDTEEITVKCNDIFKPLPDQETPVKTVLTKGIAGIGKTVLIQKFILDWAEGRANTDITFVFPLPFRQLNHFHDKEFSLMGLIHHFFPPIADIENIHFEDYKVLFIFDGLDECRLPLNDNCQCWCSVKESVSLNILLMNLIQGNLLPSALLWITSRPAAVNQIPPQYIQTMTEIRGFNDPQKDEYFRKKFSNDEKLAERVISHVRSCRSLYIMCHMPVFCWISATFLGKMLTKEDSQEMPKSLTQMYTNLLLIQTKIKNQKYTQESLLNKNEISKLDKTMIISLGQLAFQQLIKGNIIFYEEDLRECGIDAKAASMYSGMFTEIFKEEFEFDEQTVYCFVHLSIQEYLAALFVHFRYINTGENSLNASISKNSDLYELHKSAVSMALESKNGHFDLFLRFLLGISLESNQKILPCVLSENSGSLQSCEKTIKFIKQELAKNLSAERAINLFHCLNELNDNTLVEEIQNYLRSGSPMDTELSPDQCSALAYVLLMSTDVLEDFDLSAYNSTAAGRRRLLPVLKICKRACLHHCNMTKFLMEPVIQVLQSPNSLLIHLDLSYNKLGETGVKLLCDSLKASTTLQVLGLGDCNLTGSCCEGLASLLIHPLLTLKELQLRGNDLGDSGVELLCGALKETSCQLQRLGLSGCRVTEKGCASLASALQSNRLYLTELDLSYNHPGDLGLELLSAAQKVSKLETLIVDHCGPCRDQPGFLKYACQLSLDPNTVNPLLYLSEGNKKVTYKGSHSYPDHPERFEDWVQVLCKEGLSGRCYWEVEWEGGGVDIAVAYKGISRKGRRDSCGFGFSNQSWKLSTPGDIFLFFHDGKSSGRETNSSRSRRVGVYLDWPAGVLAFYRIDKHTVLVHQVITKFTEPLHPGFSVSQDYSLSISDILS
ncbi:NACHT, LRR and PYD domains-containing protein 5-like isoform X8 [Brienomyrus brachyistius]|nr:NACHT, LRR and PYD domains-containing protein 5-like isoform X8 [Brienomyrus brachyistius]